ncbi:hypothetical protein OHB49_44070 (plasmid) [Streptomyces sp. NBC_01717]|uniref:hypothetical protein n=1 Tax=Streptomyces sp. NBC_01717 TaxID=2975918 RepID=UPI002E321E8E|nr:hypothetical protein [Streptomyces sp. NBC_01717]
MGRLDKATPAANSQRRADAIDMRLAGVDWLTLARKLAADPATNTDHIAYPQGSASSGTAKARNHPPTPSSSRPRARTSAKP